jgi:hypothetical protein
MTCVPAKHINGYQNGDDVYDYYVWHVFMVSKQGKYLDPASITPEEISIDKYICT